MNDKLGNEMKVLLSIGIVATLLAGCHRGAIQDQHAATPKPSANFSVTATMPSSERWISFQTHMQQSGYVVEKYDSSRGNTIADLQGNTIGTTVFAFFPLLGSWDEIQAASPPHGVIYHINLPARMEMRFISFANDTLAETHSPRLLRAFMDYKGKDSLTTGRTVTPKPGGSGSQ